MTKIFKSGKVAAILAFASSFYFAYLVENAFVYNSKYLDIIYIDVLIYIGITVTLILGGIGILANKRKAVITAGILSVIIYIVRLNNAQLQYIYNLANLSKSNFSVSFVLSLADLFVSNIANIMAFFILYSFTRSIINKRNIELKKNKIFWVYIGILIAAWTLRYINMYSLRPEIINSLKLIDMMGIISRPLADLLIVLFGLIYAKMHESDYLPDDSYKIMQSPKKVRITFLIAVAFALFVNLHQIIFKLSYIDLIIADNFPEKFIYDIESYSTVMYIFWIVWLSFRINRLYLYANKKSWVAKLIYWTTGVFGAFAIKYVLSSNKSILLLYTVTHILAAAVCLINYEINYKIIAKAKKIDEPIIDENPMYYRW